MSVVPAAIPGLSDTPPEIAFMLGFFIALSLRRDRIREVMDMLLGRVTPEGGETDEG